MNKSELIKRLNEQVSIKIDLQHEIQKQDLELERIQNSINVKKEIIKAYDKEIDEIIKILKESE